MSTEQSEINKLAANFAGAIRDATIESTTESIVRLADSQELHGLPLQTDRWMMRRIVTSPELSQPGVRTSH
jgi:hypothetical protein